MNVMKNWGCLNKIKLVGILLVRGPYFIFHPVSLPPHHFSVYSSRTVGIRSTDNLRYVMHNIKKMYFRDYY